MADVIIENVPDDVLAAIDARAHQLGLSRGEYLRRLLARDATRSDTRVTRDDLDAVSTTFTDLGDADVMTAAWH